MVQPGNKKRWSNGLALLAGVGLLAIGGCGPKEQAGAIPPKIEIRLYNIPSAIVDYEISGLKTGRERLYFDTWGARQVSYTHTKMQVMGLSQEENILKILDGQWSYTIDLPKATGIREKNPLLKTYVSKIKRNGQLLLGDEVIRDMGGRKAGSNYILGHSCQVWIVPKTHTSYCLWKHLPLLTVMSDSGIELVSRAVSINENVPLKQDIFKIPESISIRDTDPAPAK